MSSGGKIGEEPIKKLTLIHIKIWNAENENGIRTDRPTREGKEEIGVSARFILLTIKPH